MVIHLFLHRPIINTLQKELDQTEQTLDELIKDTPDWHELMVLLTSVKGVGKVLAYTLLSDLPELVQLNKKEIAALVGVAPMSRESGSYQGKRWSISYPHCAVYVHVISHPKQP